MVDVFEDWKVVRPVHHEDCGFYLFQWELNVFTYGYFDGLLALVVEDLVKVADELGAGLLVQVNRHYFVYLGQRAIDEGFVLFFNVAPHLHLLQVFSWY